MYTPINSSPNRVKITIHAVYFDNMNMLDPNWLTVDHIIDQSNNPLPSVADSLIDCATTSFAIHIKSCLGPRADRLPIHDRGFDTESNEMWQYM